MIDSVGLQFLFVLAVLFVASAWAQTDPFPLATTGCSKIHSSPHEDGAIGIVPPTPITGGTVKKVHYFLTGGDGKAIGCTSSGSVVACNAENSTSGPILTVMMEAEPSCTAPAPHRPRPIAQPQRRRTIPAARALPITSTVRQVLRSSEVTGPSS